MSYFHFLQIRVSSWTVIKLIMKFHFDKVKENLQSFCDGTSMHGFREAFNSTSTFWRLIWLIFIATALCMTSYQLCKAVDQFTDSSTSTYTVTANENDMYPPLRFCFLHWVYWVDFDKAFALNFTKKSILYGLSFVSNIFTEDTFDYEEAKTSFKKAMASNNFTLLKQFYRAIAKDVRLLYEEDDRKYEGIPLLYHELYFKEINKLDTKYWGPLLCYSTSGDIIAKSINGSRETVINLVLEDSSIWSIDEHITTVESRAYILDWFKWNTFYTDYNRGGVDDHSKVSLPLMFYPDGYGNDYIQINENVAYYTVNMQISVHRWLNQPKQGYCCLLDQKYITSNNSAASRCEAAYPDKVCKCKELGEALVTEMDKPEKLHQYQVFTIKDDNNMSSSIPVRRRCISFNATEKLCNVSSEAKRLQKECEEKIIYPCEAWTYTFTLLAESFNSKILTYLKKTATLIQVMYPYPYDIIIMIETDRQTWEDFIGNVGGLIGVWTGASLMSIFQLFYLCCCTKSSPKFSSCSCLHTRTGKSSKRISQSEQKITHKS